VCMLSLISAHARALKHNITSGAPSCMWRADADNLVDVLIGVHVLCTVRGEEDWIIGWSMYGRACVCATTYFPAASTGLFSGRNVFRSPWVR
jgi:hypothetical protein